MARTEELADLCRARLGARYYVSGILPLVVLIVSCGGQTRAGAGAGKATPGNGGSGASSGETMISASSGAVESGSGALTQSGSPSDSGNDEDSGADASCAISAGNYDQSCSVDSDCVAVAGNFAVQFGDYCQQMCICPQDSINVGAVGGYVADVSKTPLGSGQIAPEACSCTANTGACCRSGKCTTDSCPVPGFVPYDAGQSEMPLSGPLVDGSVLCALHEGPVDASSDDTGPSRWCEPSQSCTPYNGGWECCSNVGSLAFCVPTGD
jgi:hypothetical protein